MAAQPGRRARNKERTRLAIVTAALRLFAERGYQSVTVAEIAEAADIAPATFFLYFPTKADVLFGRWRTEGAESFRQRLAGRPAGESALEALSDWVEHDARAFLDTDEDATHRRLKRQIISSDNSLMAAERQRLQALEVTLAAAVAEDIGERPDELRPSLIAAAAMSALNAMVRYEVQQDRGDGHHPYELTRYVDAFLTAGLDALQKLPRPS
jgi:AcrR family transcriptional regulator